MKNIFRSLLVFGVAFLGLSAHAQQALPSGLGGDAFYEFNAYNISQANQDATVVGARAGDTIKYEITFGSQNTDVTNFVASVNIQEVLQAATLIDAGLGTLTGNTLIFPSYSHAAPCQKKFSFFVRVKKDCGIIQSMDATANNAITRNVTLDCEPVIVPKTGPSSWIVALIAFFVASVIISVSVRSNKPS
jgi:hypothetical protein